MASTTITYLPSGTMPEVVRAARRRHVEVKTERPRSGPRHRRHPRSRILPMLLLIGAWILLHAPDAGRRARRHGLWPLEGAACSPKPKGRITFDDVAGIDEAKEELGEIVEFLKDPGKFQRLGGKIPKGRAAGWPAGYR